MRKFDKLNPEEVIASLRQAIIGEIHKSMRAIFIEADEHAAKVIVYYDGKIGDEVAEDFDAAVMTELYARIDGDPDLTFEFIRLDQPKLIPYKGDCVFALKDQQYDYPGRGSVT